MRTPTAERNREMFAGFKAGRTVNQLAEHYGLAPATIAAVLNAERYKSEVSAEEFYRGLRRSVLLQP